MTKRKSTVNKAGNYTKPTMRKNLFNRIKAGGKGGRPCQWSARKAQMLAKRYIVDLWYSFKYRIVIAFVIPIRILFI